MDKISREAFVKKLKQPYFEVNSITDCLLFYNLNLDIPKEINDQTLYTWSKENEYLNKNIKTAQPGDFLIWKKFSILPKYYIEIAQRAYDVMDDYITTLVFNEGKLHKGLQPFKTLKTFVFKGVLDIEKIKLFLPQI